MKRCLTALFLAAVSSAAAVSAKDAPVELDTDRTPELVTRGTVFIRGGTILTGTRGRIENGSMLVRDGKIAEIGTGLKAPAGVPVLEAKGRFVTPGIIDAHSHIASDATNEGTDNITAEVGIADVLNPQSLAIYRGLAGGVTATLILHGSANVIGGQAAVVKMKWRRPAEEMLVSDAPRIIKFALGENPKRSNFQGQPGSPTRFPNTRMGVEAILRRGFDEAKAYKARWAQFEREKGAVSPRRDLRLETLADILDRKIWVHCHAYRADEMLMLTRLSKEYGFKVAAFQHALEAYRITPELAAAGIGMSTFADLWAYKAEAWEAIPYNAALCRKAGIISSVNSDDAERMRRLNLDAAKSMKFGGLDADDAMRLVTYYPAQQLGIDKRTGSLEKGKDADVAVWDGHPLSVYSRCVATVVDGELFFQRKDAFELDKSAVAHAEVTSCATDHHALPLPAPAKVYALINGTVHPVSGPVIPGGTVVLQNGRILAVGARVEVPSGATVVDAKGLHVYPGMIDAGSQLGLTEIGSVRGQEDTREYGDLQPDLIALTAVNSASEHFAVTRYDGVTSTFTRPTGSLIAGQGSIINLDGWTPDEMAVKPAAGLFVTYPEAQVRTRRADPDAGVPPTTRADTLREYLERAKRYATLPPRQPGDPQRDPRLEALRPYVTGKLPVIFQADSATGIKGVLDLSEKIGLKAIIAGGREAWRVAEQLAKKDVPVIYGGIYTLPLREWDPYDVSYAVPALLHRAGVKVCFQTNDASTAKELPHQIGIACAYGLPAEAGLRAATLDAARILGVEKDLGSLEPGKLANVIVTDGDPLENVTSLHYLFINGKPVSLESKHTRSFVKYRQRLGATTSAKG